MTYKKCLIEKNLQMKVFAFLITLLQGLIDFGETLIVTCFLRKSYRVCKDIQYIPNALFLI